MLLLWETLTTVSEFTDTREKSLGPQGHIKSKKSSLQLWAQSGSQGGTAHTAPGSSLLSELCFDVANGLGIKDGFAYHHQLPEAEMVAGTQATGEKKRRQDGGPLGRSLVSSNLIGP